jgi:hypothetical protein
MRVKLGVHATSWGIVEIVNWIEDAQADFFLNKGLFTNVILTVVDK